MKEPNLIIENLKAILEECTASEDAVSYVNSEDAGTLKAAIEALEKQEKDRWIPVTERLPELDTDVLITDQYGDIWQATYIDWCGDERFVTAEESITIEVVVAWRPLPDPYKAEEES